MNLIIALAGGKIWENGIHLKWMNLLGMFLKHGYGESKLYTTTFFSCHLTDETVCMTLKELYDKAIDYEGSLWSEKH